MTFQPESSSIRVQGVKLHYLNAGSGPPVLLLHGWPTSSFLWRDTLEPLAATNRVIALDLPGYGRSDKPLDASYSFPFFERMLSGFVDALEIPSVGLAVHDLGGPLGLYWGLRNQSRLRKLALLNTLVYPEPSWAVMAFVAASYLPLVRSLLVSPRGLELAMRIGICDKSRITPEMLRGVQEPFRDEQARKVLLKSAHSLHPGGMREIAELLPSYEGPLRIIYGAKDRILPDVHKTMERVARQLPHAEVTRFESCGHFLQEERGAEIGRLLSDFFAEPAAA